MTEPSKNTADQQDTLPPSDPSDNAAALALLRRLERGLDRRLTDIELSLHARLDAFERRLNEQGIQTDAIQSALKAESTATHRGQTKILDMLTGYQQNAITFAALAEKIEAGLTQLQHAHRAIHGEHSLPPPGEGI